MWTVRHPAAAVPARHAPRPAVWVLVVAGSVGLTVLTRALKLWAVPAPDDAEVSLVGQVLALADIGEATSGVSPAALQIAGWTATGAWDRASTVLDAVRDGMLLTSAVTALLVWFLARRLGVGRAWAAMALVLLAVCPPLLDVQRTVVAANVALPWMLGAMLLASGSRPVRYGGLLRDAGVVGCVMVGGLTGPIVLTLVPTVLWLAAPIRDRRQLIGLAVAVVAFTGGALLIANAAGFGPALRDPGLGNLLDPGRASADPFTPMIVAVVTVIALAPRRTRPLAAGLILTPVVAVLTGTPWAGVVAAVVPVAVLLLAALVGEVVDTAARPVRHRQWHPRAHLYAPVATAAVVLVALTAWSPNLARLPATLDAGATEAARQWLAENGSTADLVLADSRTRLAVLNARDWARTGVGTAAGPVVASFGQGADEVVVRAAPVTGLDAAREERARRSAGEMLAASSQLEAAEPVRALLRQGRVNPQATLTLGTLLTDQRIRMVDLPVVEAEDAAGQPRRHLLLQPIDGDIERVLAFYLIQREPFRPAAAVRTPDGVLVSYPPVPPPGLLDTFLPKGPS